MIGSIINRLAFVPQRLISEMSHFPTRPARFRDVVKSCTMPAAEKLPSFDSAGWRSASRICRSINMVRLISPRWIGDWKGRPDRLSLAVKCFSSGLPGPGRVMSDAAIFETSTISNDRMMSAISQISKFPGLRIEENMPTRSYSTEYTWNRTPWKERSPKHVMLRTRDHD